MKLLTNEKEKSLFTCHYTGEHRGAAHSICSLKYSVAKKIPVVFGNESNHDYHFMITELTEKLKRNSPVWEKILKNT